MTESHGWPIRSEGGGVGGSIMQFLCLPLYPLNALLVWSYLLFSFVLLSSYCPYSHFVETFKLSPISHHYRPAKHVCKQVLVAICFDFHIFQFFLELMYRCTDPNPPMWLWDILNHKSYIKQWNVHRWRLGSALNIILFSLQFTYKHLQPEIFCIATDI